MKVLAFTSIRSDYDLLSPLYTLLDNDEAIDFRILVSGAHLSKAHGYTVNEIQKDGFCIFSKIETLLSSDSAASRVKSAAILLQGMTDTVAEFSPDLLVYAGDREDVLMYAMLGGYLSIPSIHFFAGDHVTDGYIDNPIRHATSKLSTTHFVTLEQHRKRLIKMGELPERVYTVGNISLDKFVGYQPIEKCLLLDQLGVKDKINSFALMIFHPVTEEIDRVDEIYENILKNLEENNIFTFVSYPNVDPGSFKLLEIIKKYENNQNFHFFKNLDRDSFLSLYKYSKFMIGNSSSGIAEAASIPIPAINVGLRQTGRYAENNVIFCDETYEKIKSSIQLAQSDSFLQKVKSMKNPYGDGKSAIKAYDLIKKIDFKKLLAKKEDALEVDDE